MFVITSKVHTIERASKAVESLNCYKTQFDINKSLISASLHYLTMFSVITIYSADKLLT